MHPFTGEQSAAALQQSLKRTEARLAAMTAASGEALIGVAPGGAISQFNPAAERVFRRRATDVAGGLVARLLPDLKLSNRATSEWSETRAIRGDGSRFQVEVRFTPFDAAGQTEYVLGVREAASAEDGQAGRAFRRVVDSNMIGISFIDANGSITEANDAFLELTGYSREDLEAGALRSDELTPPEFWDRDRQAFEDAARRGVCAPYEKEYRRKDGKRVPVLLGAAALDGGAVSFALDIAEGKRAEEALRESEARLRLALKAGRMGVWDWDVQTNRMEWSGRLDALQGLGRGAFTGTFDSFLQAVHPDDRQSVSGAATDALNGKDELNIEFRVFGRDGNIHWVAGQGRCYRDDSGRAVRMIGLAMDITARKNSERELLRLKDNLTALVDASGALLGSLSLNEVPDSILKLAQRTVAADAYAVWRAVPGTDVWRIVTASGVSEEFRNTPITGAVHSGQTLPQAPLVVENPESVPALQPRREAYKQEGIRSLLTVPLRFRGAGIGTIAFYFRHIHHVTETELHTASALANLAASAIGIAELYEHQSRIRSEAQAAEGRATFLADAGAILSSSLDYETTLASVARLAVPHIADWCGVDMVDDDGSLRHLAVAHADPSKVAWARELQRRYPLDPQVAGGVYQVIRTGQPELVPDITEAMLVGAAVDRGHLDLLRGVGFRSYMCVPLATRGRTLGAITFVSAESGRRFNDGDLALVQDLARRVALAVDNALLYATANRERAAAERTLAALQASETRFRQLADSGVIGIVIGDSEGVTEANDVFLEMIGYTRADLEAGELRWSGLTPPEWAHHDERARRELEERGAHAPFEKEYIRKDGSRAPILIGTALLARSPRSWISYVVDLAERKRLEERLRESQKLESIGLLAGGIAHDFNNLLTGVLGNASLAMEDLPDGSPARRAIDNVIHASERAADLTRQLLAYSGRGRFIIQPVNISDMVRKIASLLHATLPKKVTLVLDLARNLPPVDADPGQIQQLAMNLVINAAEAIGDAPGTVRLATTVRRIGAGYVSNALINQELTPGDYVRFAVEDTGVGMDDETRARIFDPFYTTKFTGRGLGLAAVLGIVRGHHGDIQVKSQRGVGSSFEILLPVAQARTAAPEPAEHKDLSGSGTVLVVDDEEVVVQTARSALERYGYNVLVARDGAEGLRVFRQNAGDVSLVLLDMTMPVMNGEEAFIELRGERSDLQVVISSGFSETEAEQRFKGAGVSGFIQKPYTAAQLAEKVQSVLHKAGRSAAGEAH